MSLWRGSNEIDIQYSDTTARHLPVLKDAGSRSTQVPVDWPRNTCHLVCSLAVRSDTNDVDTEKLWIKIRQVQGDVHVYKPETVSLGTHAQRFDAHLVHQPMITRRQMGSLHLALRETNFKASE